MRKMRFLLPYLGTYRSMLVAGVIWLLVTDLLGLLGPWMLKVGIDGVLLGAWSDVQSSGKMLDVGTGTGLIALMIAQRSPAGSLWAVVNEESAFEQAKVNIGNSPFSGYTDARSQWHGFRPYHQSTYTGHLHHCFQRLCPGRI